MDKALSADQASRIVVVNDDTVQLKLLTRLLEHQGFCVVAYGDAASALERMSAQAPPDLIITDLYMPGIDGWRFCRLLRSPEYPAFNRTPILVVSATFSGAEAEKITADLGANAFLPSPFHGAELIEQVRRLLARQVPQRASSVLIVEDTPSISTLLLELFQSHGYHATAALNGREARELFSRNPYDLVVLDYHLPDLLGDALLLEFQVQRPDSVIVMTTGDLQPRLALDWMQLGACAYVHKPFEPEYLFRVCENACRERALLRIPVLLEQRTRELRESEERQRLALKTARLAYWRYDVPTRAVQWFEGHQLLFGIPLESFGGTFDAVQDCILPEDRPAGEASLRRTLETGAVFDNTYRVPHPGGEIRWLHSFGHLVQDAGGLPGYIFGVTQDITGRWQAEENARKVGQLLQRVLDAAPLYICWKDRDSRFLGCNQSYARLVGLSGPAEITGKSDWDLSWSAEQVEFYLACDRRVMESAIPELHIVEQGTGRDGRVVWFETNKIPLLDSAGKVEGLLVICEDITQRKLAEAERERLLSAIEQSGETIVITDPDGIIQYVNPSFERITGYCRQEAVGRDARFLKGGLADDVQDREMWRTIEAGQTWQGRLVNRRKDGSLLTEDVTISPVKDAAGRIVNHVAARRDVTEQLRIQEEKEHLEEQFQQAQKMEAVGRLAGGVAHDLNNLMTPILGYGEMLMAGLANPEESREFVVQIVRAGECARDLVAQLLAFSRKQVLEFKVFELNRVVADFRKLLRRTIREDIAIEFRPAPANPRVRGDVGQLEQAIMNLAINAQDAMTRGGELTISTALCRLDNPHEAAHQGVTPGSYALLSLSDTGHGMDAAIKARIFEPFFTTKEKGKGTGLGLATTYGIVKQHGGAIAVDSAPGRGATFNIYLPALFDAGAPCDTKPLVPPGSLRGSETILLVEDHDMVRDLAHTIIRQQGYTVLLADNGMEALKQLEQHAGAVHLLLTDVIMPKMNGRELFAKASEKYPALKVLYMSGYAEDVIPHHGDLSADEFFIRKPFTVQSLTSKLREVLDRSSSIN